jgi:hypothetical protein
MHIEHGGGHGKDGEFGPWWPKPSRYNWADHIIDRIDQFLRTRVFAGADTAGADTPGAGGAAGAGGAVTSTA